jgi:hypothetical protein
VVGWPGVGGGMLGGSVGEGLPITSQPCGCRRSRAARP